MNKYKLTARVTVSVYTTVYADSIDEAIEEAEQRSLASITPTGGETEEDVWMCDELDGYPYEITEE